MAQPKWGFLQHPIKLFPDGVKQCQVLLGMPHTAKVGRSGEVSAVQVLWFWSKAICWLHKAGQYILYSADTMCNSPSLPEHALHRMCL